MVGRPLTYHLVNGDPVPTDPLNWARWKRDHAEECIVGRDELGPDGRILVSTVFMGADHAFDNGPPILWETMIFAEGMPFDQTQWRYRSLVAARAGHAEAVSRVKRTLLEEDQTW